jgi:hypothetical protein
MFKLNNDITLLLIGFISFFKHEIPVMGQRIKFSLLAPRVICADKLESKQSQCPSKLMLIQKQVVMKYYKFNGLNTLISC